MGLGLSRPVLWLRYACTFLLLPPHAKPALSHDILHYAEKTRERGETGIRRSEKRTDPQEQRQNKMVGNGNADLKLKAIACGQPSGSAPSSTQACKNLSPLLLYIYI
jgi:hypothetical protein